MRICSTALLKDSTEPKHTAGKSTKRRRHQSVKVIFTHREKQKGWSSPDHNQKYPMSKCDTKVRGGKKKRNGKKSVLGTTSLLASPAARGVCGSIVVLSCWLMCRTVSVEWELSEQEPEFS